MKDKPLTIPLTHAITAEFSAAFKTLCGYRFCDRDAFALTQMRRRILSAINSHQNARNRLIMQHGETVTEDGKTSLRLKPEAAPVYQAEMAKLLGEEINIGLDRKLKLPAGVQISPDDMEALADILELPGSLPEVADIKSLEELEAERAKVVAMPETVPLLPPGRERVEAMMK
jgi:hypothetical protein